MVTLQASEDDVRALLAAQDQRRNAPSPPSMAGLCRGQRDADAVLDLGQRLRSGSIRPLPLSRSPRRPVQAIHRPERVPSIAATATSPRS